MVVVAPNRLVEALPEPNGLAVAAVDPNGLAVAGAVFAKGLGFGCVVFPNIELELAGVPKRPDILEDHITISQIGQLIETIVMAFIRY